MDDKTYKAFMEKEAPGVKKPTLVFAMLIRKAYDQGYQDGDRSRLESIDKDRYQESQNRR